MIREGQSLEDLIAERVAERLLERVPEPYSPIQWETVKAAAKRIDRDYRTVYNWVKTGKVRGCRAGAKCIRIDPQDLDRAMKTGELAED